MMTTDNLIDHPLLHKMLLDEIERQLRTVYPGKSLSSIFSQKFVWHGGTFRRLYNFHSRRVVSEIPVPEDVVSTVRDKIVVPYIDREAKNANLTKIDVKYLNDLFDIYKTRISNDDGRKKGNYPAPIFWEPSGARIWSKLIKSARISGLQLRDRDVALQFIISFTENTAFESSHAEARTNAWVIAKAIHKHADIFPVNDEDRYQLQAFACTRGIYQCYVLDDIRSMIDFKRLLESLRYKCKDSLPAIGLNMLAYYESKIMNNFNFMSESPCTNVIEIYKDSVPDLYKRMGWDYHAHFRHLNDELLLRGIGPNETVALRGGSTLKNSLEKSVDTAYKLGCNECYIGTQLSLASCIAQYGDIKEAKHMAERALQGATSLERVNAKTRARSYEVFGQVMNLIDTGSGDEMLIEAKRGYLAQKARFSAWYVDEQIGRL